MFALAYPHNQSPVEPVAVTIGEACAMLRLGETTVKQMINDERLVSFKVGRRRLILADSIRAFAAARGDVP